MKQSITILAALVSMAVLGQSSVSRIAIASRDRDTLYIDSAFLPQFHVMWKDTVRPVFIPVHADQLDRMSAPASVRKRKRRCTWG